MFSEQPTQNSGPDKSDSLAALPAVVIHGALWIGLVTVLLRIVPRYKRVYADFGMKLPLLTEWLIDISDLMLEFWPLLIVVMAVFLALNGGISFLLYSYRSLRWAYWLWFTFMALLPLGAGFLVALGIWEPLTELYEGLSK